MQTNTSNGANYTQHSSNRSDATPNGAKSQGAKEKVQYDLPELKRKVGHRPFTERIQTDSEGFSACPFHDGDSDKSFHLIQKEDRTVLGTCFSECNKSWDAIDFVKKFDTVDTGQAIRTLATLAKLNGISSNTLPKKEPAVPMTSEKWTTLGRDVTDGDVQKLAASRPHSMTPSASALKALGFRVAEKGDGLFIVAPYRIGKTFYTLKARNLSSKEFIQENAVSQQGLFNIDDVKPGSDVYVVESELDAAVLYENGYTAVSVVGAKQKSIEAEVLKKLNTANRIFLLGDNDTPGIMCMDAIAKLLPADKVYRMPLVDVKDIGEWALSVKSLEAFGGGFKENFEQLRTDALSSWVKNNIPFISEIPNQPQQWGIDKLLPWGGFLLISAKYGHMKSLLALWLAAGIESGETVIGRKVLRKIPVLYIDRENPKATVGDRRVGLGIADSQIRYWGDWFDDMPTPGLDDPRLAEFAIREQGVIIFDSLCDWLDGANENDPSQMAELMLKFRRLARLGAGVIVLHHRDKYRSGYRGSTAIPAGCDMAVKMTKDEETGILKLETEKFRMCAEWELEIKFHFGESYTCEVLSDKTSETKRKDEAQTEVKAVKAILANYHEDNQGAGVSQTQLLSLLVSAGIGGRPRAQSVIAQGINKHWNCKPGNRNAVLYYLIGWKNAQRAF